MLALVLALSLFACGGNETVETTDGNGNATTEEQNNQTTIKAATQIMITPHYRFRIIEGLVTNFHQPQSTLLLLISAIVGAEWRTIYGYAMDHGFRFLSYGDSSLLMINKQQ